LATLLMAMDKYLIAAATTVVVVGGDGDDGGVLCSDYIRRA